MGGGHGLGDTKRRKSRCFQTRARKVRTRVSGHNCVSQVNQWPAGYSRVQQETPKWNTNPDAEGGALCYRILVRAGSKTPLAISASGRTHPGGLRKGRGMSLMPGIYGDQLTRTRGMGKKIRGGGRMGQKGGLHAAGSGRMARYGSDGPSQRPASPRWAQKGAGDVVSSVESLTRTDTKT